MKKLIFILFLLLPSLAYSQFAGQCQTIYAVSTEEGGGDADFTDNLNALNAGTFGGQGDWEQENNTCSIYKPASDAEAYPNTADECGVYYDMNLGTDHWVQWTIPVVGNTYWGPTVRNSGGSETYYAYYGNNSKRMLCRVVSGNYVRIGTEGPALTANDVLKLSIVGTTLTCYINDALDTTVGTSGTATDSNISSGNYVGGGGYGAGYNTRGDDPQGGAL